MLAFLCTIVLTFAVFGSSQATLSDEYENSTRLDTKNETAPTYELYWTYNKNEATISFAARAKTGAGWVGLGFTTQIDNTTIYDVVRGSLDTFADNKTEIYDFHAVGKNAPIKDTHQDLMNTSVAITNDSYAVLKFKRLLDTQDSNDTVIKPGPMIVLWSFGKSAALQTDAAATGNKIVTLIPVGELNTTPTTITGTTSKPKDTGSSADVYQVRWMLLAFSAVLYMTLA